MIHGQLTVPNWLEAVWRLPDGALVKWVDNGQVFREVKGIASERGINIYTCLRHWYDGGQVFGGTYEQNKDRARVFLETFIDGTFVNDIAPYCDYIEEWNEYIATSDTASETEERVRWARAVADVWLNEYRTQPALAHIKLVLCNTAIGNWIHRDFAVVARDLDCAIGYHPYTAWGWDNKPRVRWGEDEPLDNGVLDTIDWVYLSGLWDSMEYDWGIDVDWVFTEAGPFESAVTGWRASECLGGDRDLYVSAMRDWIRDVQTTPAYADGRIKGFGLFTTDAPNSGRFASYRTDQPELNSLADMFAQEWHPGSYVPPDPPDPPDPPGEECRGDPREQYARVFNVIADTASEAVAIEVFKQAWRRARETVGGSYDDAGIGNLNTRVARLHGIPATQHNVFRLWYAEYYPGVVVEFYDFPETLHLIWPVDNGRHIYSGYPVDEALFDAPRSYYGNHEGVDLYAEHGDLIFAALPGVVTWADSRRQSNLEPSDYGNHIVINHDDGYATWYAHLDSMGVTTGTYVEEGDVIGRAGSTGRSTGVHLHFSLQYFENGLGGYILDDVIDPAPYLGL